MDVCGKMLLCGAGGGIGGISGLAPTWPFLDLLFDALVVVIVDSVLNFFHDILGRDVIFTRSVMSVTGRPGSQEMVIS